jgi:hypothetical protein
LAREIVKAPFAVLQDMRQLVRQQRKAGRILRMIGARLKINVFAERDGIPRGFLGRDHICV